MKNKSLNLIILSLSLVLSCGQLFAQTDANQETINKVQKAIEDCEKKQQTRIEGNEAAIRLGGALIGFTIGGALTTSAGEETFRVTRGDLSSTAYFVGLGAVAMAAGGVSHTLNVADYRELAGLAQEVTLGQQGVHHDTQMNQCLAENAGKSENVVAECEAFLNAIVFEIVHKDFCAQ